MKDKNPSTWREVLENMVCVTLTRNDIHGTVGEDGLAGIHCRMIDCLGEGGLGWGQEELGGEGLLLGEA